MERKWTEQQEKAITTNGSVLVSASAGTGKTTVLTERVIREILVNNINISNMLIMTFSSAAAREMQDRIKAKIMEMAEDENLDRNKRNKLWGQIKLFDNSHIQTIHSFCNEIIGKYSYLIGLGSKVKVADIYDSAIMKAEIAEEIADKEFAMLKSKDPFSDGFKEIADFANSRTSLESLIINGYEKVSSFIDYKNWLRDNAEMYNISEEDIPEEMVELIRKDFEDAINGYNEAIEMVERIYIDKLEKVLKGFKQDKMFLENVILELDKGNFSAADSINLQAFGITVRFPSGDYDEIKKIRNTAKDLITNKYKKTGFCMKEQVKRIQDMYKVVYKFIEMILQFDQEYSRRKRSNGLIDFTDMEHFAYQLLQKPEIANECKGLYSKVFVDEYQDTNPVQEAIIEKIATKKNLFCVGDLKQSIYRFRSSEPQLFENRHNKYVSDKTSGKVISLNRNFRSAKNILDCANDVFSYITEASKEMNYGEEEQLQHGRPDGDIPADVNIELIPESLSKELDIPSDEVEAVHIVDLIEKNIGEDIYDSKTGVIRKAEYKDIAVLCRKLSGIGDCLAKTFQERKIPFIMDKSGSLLDTAEAQSFLNIIRLVNNKKNDIALLSAIRMGLFDFNDGDIVSLLEKSGDTYYDKMMNAAYECDTDETGKKCHNLFQFLDKYEGKQKYASVYGILNDMVNELNVLDIFAVMHDGKQKVSNVEKIIKLAHDFGENNAGNLSHFVKYLDKIKKSGINIDEAKTDLDSNCVKITTIHRSKGLEYPIVIMGFMGKMFAQVDKKAPIVMDREAGIGINYYNSEKKEKGRTIIRSYVEDTIMAKSREEEMRLLYVGMTRAQEKLYIQGTGSGNLKAPKDASCMLDWVMGTAGNIFVSQQGVWNIKTVSIEDILANIKPKEEHVHYDIPEFEEVSGLKEDKAFERIPKAIPASKCEDKDSAKMTLNMPNCCKKENSAEYGSAMHHFLFFVDFKKAFGNGEKYLNTLLEELKCDGKITPKETDIINIKEIAGMVNSELGATLANADEIKKEFNILYKTDAKSLGYQDSEDIVVRCVVDLMFKIGENYFLLDYKTDKISSDEEMQIKAESHKQQIELYRKALKNTYGIDVKGSYIAFLRKGVVLGMA